MSSSESEREHQNEEHAEDVDDDTENDDLDEQTTSGDDEDSDSDDPVTEDDEVSSEDDADEQVVTTDTEKQAHIEASLGPEERIVIDFAKTLSSQTLSELDNTKWFNFRQRMRVIDDRTTSVKVISAMTSLWKKLRCDYVLRMENYLLQLEHIKTHKPEQYLRSYATKHAKILKQREYVASFLTKQPSSTGSINGSRWIITSAYKFLDFLCKGALSNTPMQFMTFWTLKPDKRPRTSQLTVIKARTNGVLNCPKCKRMYNQKERAPLNLSQCKHTFCQECLFELRTWEDEKKKHMYMCPTCDTITACPFTRPPERNEDLIYRISKILPPKTASTLITENDEEADANIEEDIVYLPSSSTAPSPKIRRISSNSDDDIVILRGDRELTIKLGNSSSSSSSSSGAIDPPCDHCVKRPAVAGCLLCCENHCDKCWAKEHKNRLRSHHKRSSIRDFSVRLCPKHPMMMIDAFCTNAECKAASPLLCQLCKDDAEHKGHMITTLDMAAQNFSVSLQRTWEAARSKIATYVADTKHIRTLLNDRRVYNTSRRDRLLSIIAVHEAEILGRHRDHFNHMRSETDVQHDARRASLDTKYDYWHKRYEFGVGTDKRVAEALNDDDPYTVAKYAPKLVKYLKDADEYTCITREQMDSMCISSIMHRPSFVWRIKEVLGTQSSISGAIEVPECGAFRLKFTQKNASSTGGKYSTITILPDDATAKGEHVVTLSIVLCLVNYFDYNLTIAKRIDCGFSRCTRHLSILDFADHATIFDPKNGFIVGDTIVIESLVLAYQAYNTNLVNV